MARLTNQEFADAVGCDFTMSSRIRNGKRLPSSNIIHAIHEAYGLDYRELMKAHKAGAAAFAKLVNARVFDPPKRPSGTKKKVAK